MKQTSLAALLSAIALLSAGCVPGPGMGYNEVYVDIGPPPPPQVEMVGIAPYAGAVYIQGHYYPRGRSYVWQPGNWTRPRPGHRYVQHRLERTSDGRYRYRQGHWKNQPRT